MNRVAMLVSTQPRHESIAKKGIIQRQIHERRSFYVVRNELQSFANRQEVLQRVGRLELATQAGADQVTLAQFRGTAIKVVTRLHVIGPIGGELFPCP
jgi:hypothetical protein